MERKPEMSSSIAYNMDCMEYMKSLPDKAFDLAVVDPPYGDGLSDGNKEIFTKIHTSGGRDRRYVDVLNSGSQSVNAERERERAGGNSRFNYRNGQGRFDKYAEVEQVRRMVRQVQDGISVCRTGGTCAEKYAKKIIAWDIAPDEKYFEELFRVSRNQIIWGGNYFKLPPTRCFLVWKKLTISESFSMAMAEYAWTSFNENAKVFEYAPQGQKGDTRFHPTQKPVQLYEWVFNRYAKPGDKILDTHLGSGSSRIAAYKLGFDFVGCEIDKTYFDKQEERFEKFTSQLSLFDGE